MTTTDPALETFERHRPRLFGIAYRMLGTVADAEDVVQDAWLRWQRADRDEVRDAGAFLATTTTRLAMNALDSARARRESYVGPWLPEPVSTADDPLLGAERAEALSFAVLLLLERCTPAERAAYVLHEAFDYPYRRVAEVLETSEANARQLGTRARAHLASERRSPVDRDEQTRLLEAFVAAAEHGDLEGLEAVLAADVVSISDGGGVVTAARKIVGGAERVAQFLLGVIAKFGDGVRPVPVEVNGAPALLGVRDGLPLAIWTVSASADGIDGVYQVLNPHKLSRFEELAGRS
jgi:RNA polymerase sigma-70 factor (ECF subfamily)